MIYSILKWALISLILIILIHSLYNFLKNTLTIPKVKDLVNKPTEAYKEIYKIIENNSNTNNNTNNSNINNEFIKSENINNEDMKNELKSYLTDLNTSSDAITPEITAFDFKSNNDFSTYN
jgi:cell shape-determining protein MreC